MERKEEIAKLFKNSQKKGEFTDFKLECDGAVLIKYSNIINTYHGQFDLLEYLESIPDVLLSASMNNTVLQEVAVCFPRKHLKEHLRDASVRAKYDSMTSQVPEFAKLLFELLWDAAIFDYCKECGPNRPMVISEIRCGQCGRGKDMYYSYC